MSTTHLCCVTSINGRNNAEVHKVDKNNWAKTMENIVLHLKLVRALGDPTGLCGVAPCQGSPHSPGYGAHLDLDGR